MKSSANTPAEVGKKVFCEILKPTPPFKSYLDQKIVRKKINRDGPYFQSPKTYSRMQYLIEILKHNNPDTQGSSIETSLKVHFHYDNQELKEEDQGAFEKSHRFPKYHFHSKQQNEITEIAQRLQIQNRPVLQNMGTEDGVLDAQNTKVSTVVFANEQHIGGYGFPSEEHTQEEAVLKYSNAIMFMPYDESVPAKNIAHSGFESAGSYTGAEYWKGTVRSPDHPDYGFRRFGGGYSLNNKGLLLLADGTGKLLDKPLNFEPIFVAGPQRYTYRDKNPALYIQHIASVIDAQYDLAAQAAEEARQQGNTHILITGALGCGVFGNSPYVVAYLQILLLQKNEYRELLVAFCIPKSRREKELERGDDIDFRSIKGERPPKNYSVFNFVMIHFLELSRTPSFHRINQLVAGQGTYSSLAKVETDCEVEVNNLYTLKKQQPGVLSEADQSPRYTYSLYLKIIATFVTVSGILLLMILNTPLGIAAGVISMGVGLTLFAVSEKIKQDAPAQMNKINSPAPS